MKLLSERMKRDELYVVFSGFDEIESTMGFLCYGDPERTPRIYGRDCIDSRLEGSNLSVGRNFASANRRLQRGKESFVLLPLSEIVFIWGARRVKRWAKAQRDADPQRVRDYVNNYEAERRRQPARPLRVKRLVKEMQVA